MRAAGMLRPGPSALTLQAATLFRVRPATSLIRPPVRLRSTTVLAKRTRWCTRVLPVAVTGTRALSTSACGGAVAGDTTPAISYGPTDDPPLLTDTIPEHFASIVAQFPDRPAVVSRAPVSHGDNSVDGPPVAAISPPRETVYTYADLDRVSDLLAGGLQTRLGVRKGDRVAVSLGNGAEFAALTYAVYKLGAVLVPLNPAFTAAQVAAALDHLGTRVLIVGAVTDLPYKPGRGRSNLPLLTTLAGGAEGLVQLRLKSPVVPSLDAIVLVDNTADHPAVGGAGDFAQPETQLAALTPFKALTGGVDILRADQVAALVQQPPPRVTPSAPLRADDTINIQFTSGTTSQPKAAMLTHQAILNNGYFIGRRMALVPDDRIVCPPPLFHCFGCVLGYMATATNGAAILFPSPAFDPAASLQMAADHRASGLYGVATMFVAMLEHLEHDGSRDPDEAARRTGPILAPNQAAALPSHLRTGIAAGSSVPESLMRRLFDVLGLRDLVICYGMTETAPVSCMTTPDDPLSKRTGTVGRVMPHTAVKIVDPADRSRTVARGEPGELASSGYLVMQGYWGDEARTAEVLVEEAAGIAYADPTDPAAGTPRRWMHSGDEACMDADGYVTVTGRIKDLIIRAGENIHPLEIENCLFQHPLVAEVSVVGVPDARYGEVVGAFVVPHGGVHVDGGHIVEDVIEGAAIHRVGDNTSGTGAVADDHILSAADVQAWVRERLSPHLVPRHVFWTAGYPKTASGKIQKFKLRDTAKDIVTKAEELTKAETKEAK